MGLLTGCSNYDSLRRYTEEGNFPLFAAEIAYNDGQPLYPGCHRDVFYRF